MNTHAHIASHRPTHLHISNITCIILQSDVNAYKDAYIGIDKNMLTLHIHRYMHTCRIYTCLHTP